MADANTDERDTSGVENDKDAVSGQNTVGAVPTDERSFKELAESIARDNEARVLTGKDGAAGDEYLYPDAPFSAQNPRKSAIIAYKYTADEDTSSKK